jgi:hypothetical protein
MEAAAEERILPAMPVIRETLDWLRRMKRQFVCFDPRVGLANKPRRTGWTVQGSPLFDCAEPLQLDIAEYPTEELLLAVTLITQPGNHGPFSARMDIRSVSKAVSRPLKCRPDWRRYPIGLRTLSGSQAQRSARGLKLQLAFAGADARELRLGELKLERDPGRRLRTGMQGVSVPRSGHHMLVNLLQSYFGSTFQYCGYYDLCEQRPCADEVTHLQKNHDHSLDLPADEDRDYLIQYRHPLHTIVSQYEHGLRHGRWSAEQDCRQNWQAFAVDRLECWEAWIHKWVLDNENPRALKVSYEQILADPTSALTRIVTLFAPDDPLDARHLRRVIRQRRLTPRRSLEDFRYFQRDFFRDLEEKTAPTLSALKLPRLYSSC